MDYTGKAGVGKRILTDDGRLMPITSLPKEKQIEIMENSRRNREAQNKQRQTKVMRQNGLDSNQINDNSDKLLDIIGKQSDMIAKLEAKLDGVVSGEVRKEELESEVKLTPKQQLQKECDELGIAYADNDTIKSLKKLIEAETMEVVADDDPRYKENEDNSL